MKTKENKKPGSNNCDMSGFELMLNVEKQDQSEDADGITPEMCMV